mmetsp:Transcript_15276/g.58107  ORF Transcript_15276/g.58107 Transcript_15276/m.58107 type:complete len:241 (-) Transcript_15276:32-754(-)
MRGTLWALRIPAGPRMAARRTPTRIRTWTPRSASRWCTMGPSTMRGNCGRSWPPPASCSRARPTRRSLPSSSACTWMTQTARTFGMRLLVRSSAAMAPGASRCSPRTLRMRSSSLATEAPWPSGSAPTARTSPRRRRPSASTPRISSRSRTERSASSRRTDRAWIFRAWNPPRTRTSCCRRSRIRTGRSANASSSRRRLHGRSPSVAASSETGSCWAAWIAPRTVWSPSATCSSAAAAPA